MTIRRTALTVMSLVLLVVGAALAVSCSGGGAKQSDVDALRTDLDALQQKVSSVPDEAAVAKAAFDALDAPVGEKASAEGNALLWKIQPGLGTVMIEYGNRIANAWYAAQAKNWGMVQYQLKEMTEIQEVGEATRPGHAEDLKKFEDQQLQPLIDAAEAEDLSAFNAQYPRTLNGCNACHKNTTTSSFGGNYSFIKIVPPSDAGFHNVDWNGQ